LAYLAQALALAGRLPEGASAETWQRSAAAYDFYEKSSLLQGYEVTTLEATLKWLSQHRAELGNNSLGYLVQALAVAGRLPEGAVWQRSAAAYDFYEESSLLQGYEVTTLEATLKWLSQHRAELGNNSLGYLVLALAVAGQLPSDAKLIDWQFAAGAFDRALKEQEKIVSEINRIWGAENKSGLTGLRRLKKEFNPSVLQSVKSGKPLSRNYRNTILKYAYDSYGQEIIRQYEKGGLSPFKAVLSTAETLNRWNGYPRWVVTLVIAPVSEFFQTFNPVKFISSHDNKSPEGDISYKKLIPRIIGLALMHTTTAALLYYFFSIDTTPALRTTHH
jgi:hypothetical protein